jgi:eukaryotic-like serine/threonine-protein kinase
MGEVYLARDTRLNRHVAVKVLPADVASDPERVRRFEDEARAVATLAHPNILAIHDVGEQDGLHYLVTEMLEGESLRDALKDGPLPPRRAVEYAVQIANGLAAAHAKDIVHRDLKPENIYLTRDGHAKILDFGLAKQQRSKAAAAEGATLTSSHTALGTVMGTAAYMAPEQVRGEATDPRTDIFALGLILYEMLAGGPAFKRSSSVETMSAILKEDAPEFAAATPVAPGVDRVIRRCLEKSPDHRFQSAKDMAFALDAMSGSSTAQRQLAAIPSPRRWLLPVLITVLIAGLAIAVVVLALRPTATGPTNVAQLTFRNGYIRMARFTPDGQGVIYGAMWEGGPMQLYQGRIDSTDSQPITTDRADLLSVSKSGELAVALDRRFLSPWVPVGTVARVPTMGGAPRAVFPDAIDADWSPDGSSLAVVYRGHGRARLEFPIGKLLYENDGYLSHPRFSPDGKLIAIAEHPVFGDDRGWITLVDLHGKARKLSPEYGSLQGMAWRPDGKEIWLGGQYFLNAVDLKGNERVLYRAISRIRLQDISATGKVLVTADDIRSEIFAGRPGGPESRNLAPFPFSAGSGFSADGQVVAINTFETDTYGMWIRKVDGSPAIHVGDGALLDISSDGKMLLGLHEDKPDQLILVPTGIGETRTLPSVGLQYQYGSFLAGGKRAVVLASSRGHATRLYVQDLNGQSPPRPISEEGVSIGQYSRGVTPDGKYVIAWAPDPQDPANTVAKLFPIDGGDARPVAGVQSGELPVSWLPDGRSLLVLRMGESPATVYKVDIATGKREVWRKFVPADLTGILTMRSAYVTPDGKHYVYTTRRVLSTLYVIDGLR